MISKTVMEMSLSKKNNIKKLNFAFFTPYLNKDYIIIIFISLSIVHNQYLKYIYKYELVDECKCTYHLKTGSSENLAGTPHVSL